MGSVSQYLAMFSLRFMDLCNAVNCRVDYIAVHRYGGFFILVFVFDLNLKENCKNSFNQGPLRISWEWLMTCTEGGYSQIFLSQSILPCILGIIWFILIFGNFGFCRFSWNFSDMEKRSGSLSLLCLEQTMLTRWIWMDCSQYSDDCIINISRFWGSCKIFCQCLRLTRVFTNIRGSWTG